MIRAISKRDVPQIEDIHKKFYNDEFPLSDLHRFICSFVVVDDQEKVISAGGIRSIAEMVIVTDKDIEIHKRRLALIDMLTAGVQTSKMAGYEHLHAFIQDEHWLRHLIKYGFRPTVGKKYFDRYIGDIMAKGDSSRSQNQINQQGGQAQNQLTNTFQNLLPQNQQLQNRYNVSADQSQKNYQDMYGQYGNLMGQVQNAYQPEKAGYQNFAQTGGFSPQDIQDLRARAIAPTRAVYANAQADIDRQRALSGGYSPNYTAATAKLTRDLSQGISDANVNANASIAQAVQQGKLAGLGGLTNVDNSQLGMLNTTLGGQRSLYGTTPGQTSMYGTQLGQSNQQMNEISQLQNQLAQILTGAQNQKAGIPGDYQQALGNIGGTLGLAGQVMNPLAGLFSGGSGGLYQTGSGQTPYGYIGG